MRLGKIIDFIFENDIYPFFFIHVSCIMADEMGLGKTVSETYIRNKRHVIN